MSAKLEGYTDPDTDYELVQNGVLIMVKNGNIHVHYNLRADEPKAKELANAYIDAHILRTGQSIKADFNHSWQKVEGGQTQHNLFLRDTIQVSERLKVKMVNQRTTQANAYIVSEMAYDSASFANDEIMATRATLDATLRSALHYYAQVLNSEQPMGNIYKSIEVITKSFGNKGRIKLAKLAGEPKSYVIDLMQTTQHERHSKTAAKIDLPLAECKQRASILINAYAESLDTQI